MNLERWQQIETLYHAALDHPSTERSVWLADACATDKTLHGEVEKLLAMNAEANSFLATPALEVEAKKLAAEGTPRIMETQIGNYQILSELGAGGMGEVYRARDPRLDREVAIKILPADFAQDADRLRRFEQEAHATSALNHPNILTVYDFGSHNGNPYLVMELLEGEELRAQIAAGAIAPRKAIEYAQQIAAGLAAAHEKGVVHRDLKPENLFVTKDGRVKILDFGLAKLKPQQNTSAGSEIATQKQLTMPGTVMGTVAYMSPEQVRGEVVDHRSDIFSFGLILYEMLRGERAFQRETMAETMTAILKDDPPELSETNIKISLQLEKTVRHCLEKKPEMRFQSARDLGFALEGLSSPGYAGVPPASLAGKMPVYPGWRNRLAWLTAAVFILATLGFAWAYFTRQPINSDAHVMKFAITPPEHASFDNIAISPAGRWLAFTAATGGKVQLWVRALDASEAKALPGTEGARFPFWSPDNHWLAFFTANKLKKIEVSGGPPQTLCDLNNPTGGTWNRDGVIIFSRQSGLSRVAATGGEVTVLTTPDRAREEIAHYNPSFLPDGQHFLYSIQSGQKETRGIYLGSLDGKVKQWLLGEYSSAVYAPPGFLLFRRDETLLAQPFDADKRQLSGESFAVAERVGHHPLYLQRLNVSVSDNGVLVLDPHVNRLSRQLLWLDRAGKQIGSLGEWSVYSSPWLAPDEKRIVAERRDPQITTWDLWLADLSGANASRFTFDPSNDISPVWSPDGSRIIWVSAREGRARLYQKAANGTGQDEPLFNVSGFPTDWSRDGRFIIYYQTDPKTKNDVWVLPLDGEQKPFPFLQTEAYEGGAQLSPDGRWLAYVSDESGRFEVYVQRFPTGGSKRQISTGGGVGPHWRRDGKELFYYANDGKLMTVLVGSGESFEVGAAVVLFEFRSGSISPSIAPYTVTGDGRRFLVNAIVDAEPRAPLTVVVNWAAGRK